MSVPLSAFARPFLVSTASRALLTHPVLVWEAPPSAPAGSSDVTVAGFSALRPAARDPLVLELKKGTGKLNAFALGITVGRTENNDLVVGHDSVSRFQGYFQQDPKSGKWTYTDAGSTNGSFINGLKIEPSKPRTLGESEKLRLGHVDVLFLAPAAFFAYLEQHVAA